MDAGKIFKITVLLNEPIYRLLLFRVQFFDSGYYMSVQCSNAPCKVIIMIKCCKHYAYRAHALCTNLLNLNYSSLNYGVFPLVNR